MAAFPDWYCTTCGGNVGSFPGLGRSCRCNSYDPPEEKQKNQEKSRTLIQSERNQYRKRKK